MSRRFAGSWYWVEFTDGVSQVCLHIYRETESIFLLATYQKVLVRRRLEKMINDSSKALRKIVEVSCQTSEKSRHSIFCNSLESTIVLQLLKALISIFIVTISLYFFSCIKRCVVSSVANIIYDSLLLNITNENYNNHWKQRRMKWRREKLKTKKNTYFILTPTSYLRFKFGLQIVHTNWFDRQGAKDLRFTVE